MKEFVEKLIGRLEEQVEEHRKYWKEFGDEDSYCGMNATLNAIKIVNQLAEEYNNGWIPCEKELPKKATTYQVTEEVIINSKKQYVVDIRLFGTEGEWLCPSNRKIIAWMPLPAPFKRGE